MDETISEYEPFRIHIKGVPGFSRTPGTYVWSGSVLKTLKHSPNFRNTLTLVSGGIGFGTRKGLRTPPHHWKGLRGPRNREKLADIISDLEEVDIGSMEVREIASQRVNSHLQDPSTRISGSSGFKLLLS